MDWFFSKKKNKPVNNKRAPMTRKQQLLKLAQSNNYYSVKLTRCGCKASSRLINQCFQFDCAPSLPLSGCDAEKCSCEYLGLINRRHMQRRASMRRVFIRMGNDRRNLMRRNKEDTWHQRTN